MSKYPILYQASVLCAVAGCSVVTFRAWRNRNGLFPECEGGTGWNRFSWSDIATARAVVVLTERGLNAQTAVDAAMRARPMFQKIILSLEQDCMDVDTIMVIDPAQRRVGATVRIMRRQTSLMEVFDDLESEASIIVDGFAIVAHVWEKLKHYSRRETVNTLARALAGALDPGRME